MTFSAIYSYKEVEFTITADQNVVSVWLKGTPAHIEATGYYYSISDWRSNIGRRSVRAENPREAINIACDILLKDGNKQSSWYKLKAHIKGIVNESRDKREIS